MKNIRLIGGVVVGLLVVLGGVLLVYHAMDRGPLPASISKHVKFGVFYPDVHSYLVDKSTISYNSNTQVLSYSTSVANKKVVINQQAEPDVFQDAGQEVNLYQKLLDKMRQYQEMGTDAGTVTLTRPEELKGAQAAVMDQKGTLLFAQPAGDLTADQWKSFFNSLSVVQQ
jgi:hypothetical protein